MLALYNEVVALVLLLYLFIVKEILPYKMRKYHSRRNGKYIQQELYDAKKELKTAIFRFPSDFLCVAAGYIGARIITCTDAINNLQELVEIADLTMKMNTYYLLGFLTILFLPLCVYLCRKCEKMFFPEPGEKEHKVIACIFDFLLYVLVIYWVIWILLSK